MKARDAWSKFVAARKNVTVFVRVPNKYHAVRLAVDGHVFDSKREAGRYAELRLLEQSGAIEGLEVQPVYPIQVVALYKPMPPMEIIHIGVYHADFRYFVPSTGEIVIEDVKSPATRTTAYKFRKRLVEAIHGVTITEIE